VAQLAAAGRRRAAIDPSRAVNGVTSAALSLRLGGVLAIRGRPIGKRDDAATEDFRPNKLEILRPVHGFKEALAASEHEWVNHEAELVEEVLSEEGPDERDAP